MITLYDYFRSSASYRVRIALCLKEIAYDTQTVNLVKGEHKSPAYLSINKQGAVPFLVDGRVRMSQSLAMIEYLDEVHKDPPVIFGNVANRAYIRELSYLIACDVHPLNNLKVWKGFVQKELGADEQQMVDWYHRWIIQGMDTYEKLLEDRHMMGAFSCGDMPSMADICLVPQLYNARRFGVDLTPYQRIRKIEKNCVNHFAFQMASPEEHKDAPEDLEPIHGPNSPLLKGIPSGMVM